MIRIVSGHGRYADPWHPFADTSAGIASVAAELGVDHHITDVTPDALGDLDGIAVLVVNTGGGGPEPDLPPDTAWTEAFIVAEQWIRDGGSLLATHQACNGFPDWPGYRELLGGHWRPGTSMHPPLSDATFTPVPGAEADPLLAGLDQVSVRDERYSKLIFGDDVDLVLQHELDGEPQPVVWRRREPGLQVIVDTLGHDAQSYRSPSRRRLLGNELAALLPAS